MHEQAVASRQADTGGSWPAWPLFLVPLALAAFGRDLWAPDEPRYAEVAREISDTGSWLVMHLAGAPYPDKPPLLFWLAALLGRLSGWEEGFLRLPSLLATAGTAALVAHLARRFWGRGREALLAPVVLLTTVMVTEIGGRLQIDPLLTLLVVAAVVLATEPAATARRRDALVLAAGLAAGLGALAKGPVAWLHVLLVLGAWRLLDPAAAPPARRRAWVGAALLALLPVMIWAGLAIAAEPALLDELLFGQHLGRVVHADRHPGPPWKYLTRLPILLLPWTLPVLLGALEGARGMLVRLRRGTPAADPGLALAAAWLLVLLAVFSAIPVKRDLYLLPAYPAAALLGARWLAAVTRRPRWPLLVSSALLAVIGAALAAAPLLSDELPPLGWRLFALALPLLAGAVLAAPRALAGDAWRWAGRTAAAWLLFAAVAGALVLPALDPLKSPRPVAELLARLPQRPHTIPCLEVRPEGYRFYGGVPAVPADDAGDLAAALAAEGPQFLALVRGSAWDELPADLRRRLRVLGEDQVGSREVLVVGASSIRM